MPAQARHERLIEFFRDRVAAVLGLAPEKIDPDRPLLNSVSIPLRRWNSRSRSMHIPRVHRFPLSMLLESTGIRELASSQVRSSLVRGLHRLRCWRSQLVGMKSNHAFRTSSNCSGTPISSQPTGLPITSPEQQRFAVELNIDALRRAASRRLPAHCIANDVCGRRCEKPAIRELAEATSSSFAAGRMARHNEESWARAIAKSKRSWPNWRIVHRLGARPSVSSSPAASISLRAHRAPCDSPYHRRLLVDRRARR